MHPRHPSRPAPRARGRLAAVAASLLVASCGATPVPSTVDGTGGPVVGSASPATDAASPPGSPGPAATPVPGFESWATINPHAVRISVDGGDLVLELVGSGLWFNADRGVLFHTDVRGDFVVTATVRTSRTDDPAAPPGGDGSVQLAGLMARVRVPAENYVFVVTGSIGTMTGLESTTTTAGHSVFVQRGVGDGSMELRLCRQGPIFNTWWRPLPVPAASGAGPSPAPASPGEAGPSEDGWQRQSQFIRTDLPADLQVGATIYTDGVPDLVARFSDLRIEQPVAVTC